MGKNYTSREPSQCFNRTTTYNTFPCVQYMGYSSVAINNACQSPGTSIVQKQFSRTIPLFARFFFCLEAKNPHWSRVTFLYEKRQEAILWYTEIGTSGVSINVLFKVIQITFFPIESSHCLWLRTNVSSEKTDYHIMAHAAWTCRSFNEEWS